jgi:hypothetical protein
VAWLFVRHGDNGSKKSPLPARAQAVAVSPGGLVTLSNTSGQPIYWAGPKSGDTYELTKASDGRVWVRYLPPGVAVGSTSPYLTVGTYPLGNAYAVTRRLERKKGSTQVNAPGRAVAFYTTPTNVYVAFPGVPYQVEVYSPSASEAQATVASGAITPAASGSTPTSAHFVTVTALKKFAAGLAQPLYWAGPQSGVRYELTQTSNGNVYLRYVPRGVAAGSKQSYLTIGTYPLTNAFSATKTQAEASGNTKVTVGGGGVAFFANSRPTNVYAAFPAGDVQIEVFDPDAAQAKSVVSTKLVAVH